MGLSAGSSCRDAPSSGTPYAGEAAPNARVGLAIAAQRRAHSGVTRHRPNKHHQALRDYNISGDRYANLRAQRTTCRKARAVVRGWHHTRPDDGGWRHLEGKLHRWRCHYLVLPVRFRCEGPRRAMVRFDPGPGF